MESSGSPSLQSLLTASDIVAMHRVAERSFALPLYVFSPPCDSLGIPRFLDHADPPSVTSMPIMGATAPIHFSGAFVLTTAETIGGDSESNSDKLSRETILECATMGLCG